MKSYVALLRAVNVMGSGKLPMTALKAMCEASGLESVQTYIASGNVVFASRKSEREVKGAIEAAVCGYTGKPAGVLVRTAAEMAAVLAGNPFKEMPGNRALACFLEDAPLANALEAAANHTNELMQLGRREIYVYYPNGVGQSRLKLPAFKTATARNMNTVAKLAELAADLDRRIKG